MVASPYDFFLARAYPELRPGEQAPFRLGLLAAEKPPDSGPGADEKEIQFRVPFSVSGVQPDAIVNLAGVRVSMDTVGGSHWNSGWKMFARDIFPEQTATEIDFAMKRDEFLRMQSSPATLRIAVAYTLYHDGDKRQFVIPGGLFEAGGSGMVHGSADVQEGSMHGSHAASAFAADYLRIVSRHMSAAGTGDASAARGDGARMDPGRRVGSGGIWHQPGEVGGFVLDEIEWCEDLEQYGCVRGRRWSSATRSTLFRTGPRCSFPGCNLVRTGRRR